MFSHQIDNDLELKLLTIKDAEALYSLTVQSKSYLREWLPWVDSTKTVDDSKNFIEATLKQFAANDGFQAGIWYKGELAGVIGYHGISWQNNSTSIGYWLGEGYQGKGIMTRATRVLVEYALNELKLNRVEIRCAEKNLKSRAIPERLGFKNEGLIRQSEWLYDHYVAHFVYGMLREEWNG